jgi:hypothetical protein
VPSVRTVHHIVVADRDQLVPQMSPEVQVLVTSSIEAHQQVRIFPADAKLTLPEVAELAQVGVTHLLAHINLGKLVLTAKLPSAYNKAKATPVPISEVLDYIEERLDRSLAGARPPRQLRRLR